MQTSTKNGLMLVLLLVATSLIGTAYAQRTITLDLNTATLADTLDAEDDIQVRGSVGGIAPFTLPDGNVINWNEETTLRPENVGGDYWRISFQIPDDQVLEYKFYSQLAEDDGLGGWEDNPAEAANHSIEAGTGDVTRPLHFFAKGEGKAYDWRPWEEKEDSIAVLFRVFMHTVEGTSQGVGYDPEAADQVIGLRGDPLNGASQLDWGSTLVTLQRESDDDTRPGYHIFSGVAYYPVTAAGTEQPYKFFVEPNGWEGTIDNRTFTIPSSDTTLHWVYFSNSPPLDPTKERVEANVIFNVDVTPLEEIEVFSRARGDTMIIRGAFNGWVNCLDEGNPDACSLFEQLDGSYGNSVPVLDFVDTPINYKFYVDYNTEEGSPLSGDTGYEEPLDFGGGNRVFVFTGNDLDLGQQYFNDIRDGNVIPADHNVEVTFQVDMTPALSFTQKEVFDPDTDSVRVAFEDGIWQYTQTRALGVEDMPTVVLEDEDGDMIYTGTYTVMGPTYNAVPYRYEYGNETDGYVTEGSGGFDPGRRRYQYILPNEDGTFPAAYTLPVVPIAEAGAVPFECNPTADLSTLPESVTDLCYQAGTSPTAIEVVDSEIPEEITLSQNYPNPFNPETSFEYTLTSTQHVKVRVFDLTGRVITTLVDAVQPASTYRLTFDASGLASGVYLYQLQTANQTINRKMVLMK